MTPPYTVGAGNRYFAPTSVMVNFVIANFVLM